MIDFLKDHGFPIVFIVLWIGLLIFLVCSSNEHITKSSNYYKMPSEIIVLKTYDFNKSSDNGKNEMIAIQEVLEENKDFGTVIRSECKWQNLNSACYAIWLKRDAKWDKMDATVEE